MTAKATDKKTGEAVDLDIETNYIESLAFAGAEILERVDLVGSEEDLARRRDMATNAAVCLFEMIGQHAKKMAGTF